MVALEAEDGGLWFEFFATTVFIRLVILESEDGGFVLGSFALVTAVFVVALEAEDGGLWFEFFTTTVLIVVRTLALFALLRLSV